MVDEVSSCDSKAGKLLAVGELWWELLWELLFFVTFEDLLKFVVEMEVRVLEPFDDGVIGAPVRAPWGARDGFDKKVIPALVFANSSDATSPGDIAIGQANVALICAHEGAEVNASGPN